MNRPSQDGAIRFNIYDLLNTILGYFFENIFRDEPIITYEEFII